MTGSQFVPHDDQSIVDRVLSSAFEACHNPEAPPTINTRFDMGCAACRVALIAAISAPPPPGHFEGWWREREHVRAEARSQGYEL